MMSLITFDTETYTLDIARLSGSIVSISLLYLMKKIFKQRRYIRGTYYSPVLIFTSFWLTILLMVSLIPLVTNQGVISSGLVFTLIAAGYIWSLAGCGWLLSTYVKHYNQLIEIIELRAPVPEPTDKAD